MKKMIFILALAATVLGGCTSSTEYGDCIGFDDDEVPGLKYDVSSKNVAIGVIFSAFIVPPLIVLFDELRCPIGTTIEMEPLAFNLHR